MHTNCIQVCVSTDVLPSWIANFCLFPFMGVSAALDKRHIFGYGMQFDCPPFNIPFPMPIMLLSSCLEDHLSFHAGIIAHFWTVTLSICYACYSDNWKRLPSFGETLSWYLMKC